MQRGRVTTSNGAAVPGGLGLGSWKAKMFPLFECSLALSLLAPLASEFAATFGLRTAITLPRVRVRAPGCLLCLRIQKHLVSYRVCLLSTSNCRDVRRAQPPFIGQAFDHVMLAIADSRSPDIDRYGPAVCRYRQD
jgi:hypothetical protein